MVRKWMILTVLVASVTNTALAKLPPPTQEQQAMAAEAQAKAAIAAKAAADLLAKYQDIAVQKYAAKMKEEGRPLPPPAAK